MRPLDMRGVEVPKTTDLCSSSIPPASTVGIIAEVPRGRDVGRGRRAGEFSGDRIFSPGGMTTDLKATQSSDPSSPPVGPSSLPGPVAEVSEETDPRTPAPFHRLVVSSRPSRSAFLRRVGGRLSSPIPAVGGVWDRLGQRGLGAPWPVAGDC